MAAPRAQRCSRVHWARHIRVDDANSGGQSAGCLSSTTLPLDVLHCQIEQHHRDLELERTRRARQRIHVAPRSSGLQHRRRAVRVRLPGQAARDGHADPQRHGVVRGGCDLCV